MLKEVRKTGKITLFGTDYQVIFDKNLYQNKGVYGRFIPNELKIELQDFQDHREVITEQSFLHEVMHLVLRSVGEWELSDNEKFVETISQAVHQILKSMSKAKTKPLPTETKEGKDFYCIKCDHTSLPSADGRQKCRNCGDIVP